MNHTKKKYNRKKNYKRKKGGQLNSSSSRKSDTETRRLKLSNESSKLKKSKSSTMTRSRSSFKQKKSATTNKSKSITRKSKSSTLEKGTPDIKKIKKFEKDYNNLIEQFDRDTFVITNTSVTALFEFIQKYDKEMFSSIDKSKLDKIKINYEILLNLINLNHKLERLIASDNLEHIQIYFDKFAKISHINNEDLFASVILYRNSIEGKLNSIEKYHGQQDIPNNTE